MSLKKPLLLGFFLLFNSFYFLKSAPKAYPTIQTRNNHSTKFQVSNANPRGYLLRTPQIEEFDLIKELNTITMNDLPDSEEQDNAKDYEPKIVQRPNELKIEKKDYPYANNIETSFWLKTSKSSQKKDWCSINSIKKNLTSNTSTVMLQRNVSLDRFIEMLNYKTNELLKLPQEEYCLEAYVIHFANYCLQNFFSAQTNDAGLYSFEPLKNIDKTGRLGFYLIYPYLSSASAKKQKPLLGLVFFKTKNLSNISENKAIYQLAENEVVEPLFIMQDNESFVDFLQKMKCCFKSLAQHQGLLSQENLNFNLDHLKKMLHIIQNPLGRATILCQDQYPELSALNMLEQKLFNNNWPSLR